MYFKLGLFLKMQTNRSLLRVFYETDLQNFNFLIAEIQIKTVIIKSKFLTTDLCL